MLEKYLNKEIKVEEKMYNGVSTIQVLTFNNIIEGTLTAYDNDYIELDNKYLISRKFIYRIGLK